MSLRNTSGHGGRHIRKSTKRVKKKQPLFPKNTANRIQQRWLKEKCPPPPPPPPPPALGPPPNIKDFPIREQPL